ncbi:similar to PENTATRICOPEPTIDE REPEAT 596 [Actinidia rufa]|uniref:Similar to PENTATRICOPEPTIDE REPEAT 596 n=1 Tax=Actinidia rufa TaxID=165716 RepID=A0A7J0EDY1_9ERIC|nr:similar to PENTATRICOPEPTIDE REPEAT 596 [Actinidia rufa]
MNSIIINEHAINPVLYGVEQPSQDSAIVNIPLSMKYGNRGLSIRTSRACCAKSEVASCYLDGKASNSDSCLVKPEGYSFSSLADTKSSAQEEDDLDGFSELETPANDDMVRDSSADKGNEDELISEPELSDEEEDGIGGVEEPQNELELSDTEVDIAEKRSPEMRELLQHCSRLLWMLQIPELRGRLRHTDVFVKHSGPCGFCELEAREVFNSATLRLSEWLESTNLLTFVERDYASRLDLIAKVRGLLKAESYIEKIPKSFRGEVIYRTLLANCVAANNVKKAEQVFNKMKDLEFPITCFACNQLLLLYKRFDKKKIADVLLLMEKENVKPPKALNPTSPHKPHWLGTMSLPGLKEKAEDVLKEMEGDNIKENRWACHALLPLYAALGKADEVGRVWKVCESNPKVDECLAAIESWGKLNKVEEAEAVFDRMSNTWKKLSSKHYTALLKVYANHKKLAKGKNLVKRMGDSGCRIGPFTWDALVKLYVEAGEVEKADSILQKANQQNQMRPMFSSYMAIMDQYAKRGDIHNSEKMLHRMRQNGYMGRIRQFQALIQAYINAKVPAYGIRERMKADNIFPNKAVAGQLAQVDAFRRTSVSDLLD